MLSTLPRQVNWFIHLMSGMCVYEKPREIEDKNWNQNYVIANCWGIIALKTY